MRKSFSNHTEEEEEEDSKNAAGRHEEFSPTFLLVCECKPQD